jgi:hypothetical protein
LRFEKFFSKSRVQVTELITDAKDFLRERYRQASQTFTEGSPWGQLFQVMLNLAQLIFYFIQDSVAELNINEARRNHSIYGLARLTGHNPTNARSASGTIQIVFDKSAQSEITGQYAYLINYTKVRLGGEAGNGLIYTVILNADQIALPQVPTEIINVKLVEGKFETQQKTGNGTKLQSFTLTVKPNVQIDHQYTRVKVNGKEWSKYDSLYDIPREAEGFLLKTGINKGIDVYFGTGNFGKRPPPGANIEIDYLVTNGQAGNLQKKENVNFQFLDQGFDIQGNGVDLNQFFKAGMVDDINLGANAEDPEFTRIIAPKQSRNFVLANKTNIRTFFQKLNTFSFIDVWTKTEDNNPENDNVVYVMLIPNIYKFLGTNTNYFTVPIDAFKLSERNKTKLLNLIEESGQRVITNVIKIVNPTLRRYVLTIELGIFQGNDANLIRNEILERLSDYFVNRKRRTKIPKSDLIDVIEGIEGVDWVDVYFISKENEELKAEKPNSNETPGLDRNGNIILGEKEVPIIRGDWTDRNGIYFEELPNFDTQSSVNIYISEINEPLN